MPLSLNPMSANNWPQTVLHYEVLLGILFFGPIHPFTHPSICYFIQTHICPLNHPPTHLPASLSLCPAMYTSTCLSSIHPHTYSPSHSSPVHPGLICLSITLLPSLSPSLAASLHHSLLSLALLLSFFFPFFLYWRKTSLPCHLPRFSAWDSELA